MIREIKDSGIATSLLQRFHEMGPVAGGTFQQSHIQRGDGGDFLFQCSNNIRLALV